MTLLDNLRAACADFRVSWDDFARDPVPPGHGEPENIGARPGDYCDHCGRPATHHIARYDLHFCARCGSRTSVAEAFERKNGPGSWQEATRGELVSFERPTHAGMSGMRPDGRHDGASA